VERVAGDSDSAGREMVPAGLELWPFSTSASASAGKC
jgi:hypothetical protein